MLFANENFLSDGAMDSGEHNLNAFSVREYAYEEDKNMRFRP